LVPEAGEAPCKKKIHAAILHTNLAEYGVGCRLPSHSTVRCTNAHGVIDAVQAGKMKLAE
jgi:hypothetical protein